MQFQHDNLRHQQKLKVISLIKNISRFENDLSSLKKVVGEDKNSAESAVDHQGNYIEEAAIYYLDSILKKEGIVQDIKQKTNTKLTDEIIFIESILRNSFNNEAKQRYNLSELKNKAETYYEKEMEKKSSYINKNQKSKDIKSKENVKKYNAELIKFQKEKAQLGKLLEIEKLLQYLVKRYVENGYRSGKFEGEEKRF